MSSGTRPKEGGNFSVFRAFCCDVSTIDGALLGEERGLKDLAAPVDRRRGNDLIGQGEIFDVAHAHRIAVVAFALNCGGTSLTRSPGPCSRRCDASSLSTFSLLS